MISLCIPTYNRLDYLKPCLESMLGKFGNYPYEVIVADGGSTDGTLEYLRKNKSKNLVVIEQGKLTGITKAYNESFEIAKGDYIFIGNDDIEIFPEVFIKACKFMDKEKQIGMVSAKDLEITHNRMFGIPPRFKKYGMLLSYFHIMRGTVLKDEMKLFDENFRSYRIDEDSTLSVLKGGHTTISTKDVAMVHHRAHDEDTNKARAINFQETKSDKESNYFKNKWEPLTTTIKEYFEKDSLQLRKSLFYKKIFQTMYYAEWITPYLEKNHKLASRIYDWALDNSIIFKDADYQKIKDFHLAQRYPDEILEKL